MQHGWMIIAACMVLFMQVGFLLLEAGSVRTKNATNVAQKNVGDFLVSALCFAVFGFSLMFGAGTTGFFGFGGLKEALDPTSYSVNLLFQLTFCGVAATIASGIISERMKFSAYLIGCAALAGVIYPVFGHLVWGNSFIPDNPAFLADLGFVDLAGGTAVHSLGAWFGLAGLLLIGPRIGRFDEEGNVQPISGSSPVNVMTGTLILMLAWIAFNAGALEFGSESFAVVALNTILAAVAGGSAGTLVGVKLNGGIFKPAASTNGILAGLVAITSAAHMVGINGALALGAIAGSAAIYAEHWMLHKAKLDDPVGGIAVHGVAGVIGCVLFPFFATAPLPAGSVLAQVTVQAAGAAACFVVAFGSGLVVFETVKRTTGLRVGAYKERLGLDYAEHQHALEEGKLEKILTAVDLDTQAPTSGDELAIGFNKVAEAYEANIAELEKAEAEQARLAQLFDAAINSTTDGFAIWSPTGELIHVNQSLVEIAKRAGVPMEIGMSFRLIAPLLNGDTNDDSATSMSVEAFFDQTDVLAQISTDQFYSFRSCPIANGGYITLFVDVSAEHGARIKAELAERSKAEFLANMSHEIRTPLNGIIGMAQLLADRKLESKERHFVDTILTSSNSLLTIINDILDFSKIDAGKMELDPAPFDLEESIENILNLLSTRVSNRNVDLLMRLQPGLPTSLVGDAGRIRQILLNLVGNAVKFTDQGHVLVDVTGQRSDGIVDLTVRIEDTGCGIAPEHLSTVFEKFSQVDGSSTRKHGGTGLGLAITQRLISLMDGSVSVTSELNKGTTFTVNLRLPCHEGFLAAPAVASSLTGRHIVVIDDNETNREILKEQCESWECTAYLSDSGVHGLQYLARAANRNQQVDLVVLDYLMPELDGEQVVRAMRAIPELADIPVVILTSSESANLTRQARALGVYEVLTKPARTTRLQSTFEAAIDGASNAQVPLPTSEPEKAAADAPRALDQSKNGQIDILVAEDNEVNRMVMENLLETIGVSVAMAVDGRKAVEMWQELQPSIILMDVSMPEMNGLEATQEIRRIENGHSRVPIVALTAHALRGDRERCLDAGMDDFLTKPINAEDIRRTIDKWLRSANQAQNQDRPANVA